MATQPIAVSAMDAFFRELGNASERVLLLDYDGTLAPFHANRKAARPYLGVPELLISIIIGRTHTRVVLVTGRPAMELKSLLPFIPTPEIWGSHGLERLRADGSYEIAEIPQDAAELLSGIDRALTEEGLEPYMERKPGSIAVHWRSLSKPVLSDIRARVVRLWDGAWPQAMVRLTDFDGGMEFRLPGRDKGDAVRQILAEVHGATPVAYLGDDYSDEDAFRALKNRGLAVLVRGEYRPTSANAWIQPPQGVLNFLAEWLEVCEER